MFQIKNFRGIVASLINNVSSLSGDLTDFNIGSKNRTILEAVAREIDQAYQNLLKGIYEAVPVAIYKSFDFALLLKTHAYGYVTFTRVAGSTGNKDIPADTQVQVPETSKTFATVEDGTILNGQNTAIIFVRAVSAGTASNSVANTIIEIVDEIEGVASVTNTVGISNGRDDETEQERKVRFQEWIKNLSRAIRSAIEYCALNTRLYDVNGIETEGATQVITHIPCDDDNPPGDVGIVNVYVWNGVDGASVPLKNEVQKRLLGYIDDDGNPVPGWKGAGIVTYVYEVDPVEVDVTVSVISKSGYTVSGLEDDIIEAIGLVFEGLTIGEDLLLAELVDAIMGVDGVYDVLITLPAANEVCVWNEILIPGTILVVDGAV